MSDWRGRWKAELAEYNRHLDCEPVYHLNEARWRRLLKAGTASALELREAYGRVLHDLMNSNRYWPDDHPAERDRLMRFLDPALVYDVP